VISAAVAAQQSRVGSVPSLTPLDYVEIRQLLNRYAFALDTGSNNG
jgi:hypothetical protein